MTPSRVRIFYPADPLGVVPGGIDTFIRGLVKWSPDDLVFSLVGMTTDPVARPTGRFTTGQLGARAFEFFPAVHVADAGRRGKVPLSVRYMLAVARAKALVDKDFDVFEFHRIEPALLFRRDARPKNAFFHQDPKVLRSAQSDILWKRLPGAYEKLEAGLMPGIASAWCVRDAGVATLAARYPAQADSFRFVPTWVDSGVFSPVAADERAALRHASALQWHLDPQAQRIVSVGRLDSQKAPERLLDAFRALIAQGRRAVLLFVGDGVLRESLTRRVAELDLVPHVRFLGLQPPGAIADLLRAGDAFALSSAYEGMPMAALEAMGCGLPVATTDVGEVRRLVTPGLNGAIAHDMSVEAFTEALVDVLDHAPRYRDAPALSAVRPYQPAAVLGGVYENYRQLGELSRRASRTQVAMPAWPTLDSLPNSAGDYPRRRREQVVGAAVDVLTTARASSLILGWAEARESRYVCFGNVHSAVTARRDARHARSLAGSDLVAADGAPIAWMLRRKGHAGQPRIDGPGMMWRLCAAAEDRGIKVGLYGSQPTTLRELRATLLKRFPTLHVAFAEAPPFKPQTEAQDAATCQDIEAAGVGLLFVALGCPKQERWMAEHRGRINAVMLGVGAAFDFHAGTIGRAPSWMRNGGLEWLHRLASEPRRLWRRYLHTNSVFILRGATELLGWPLRHAGNRPVRLAHRVTTVSAGRRHPPRRPGRDPSMDQQQMTELLARVDAAIARRSGRVIEFIASGEGEGTSTLAKAYAHATAAQARRRVLLLSAESESTQRPGVFQSLADGRGLAPALVEHARGYWSGAMVGAADDGGWSLAHRNPLWKQIRAEFDEIVLDMPSSAMSRTGVMMAAHCDGVIVVLEAEKTRAPVVEALVASLQAVHANLLGTVLNKRQFHVPDALYRRL